MDAKNRLSVSFQFAFVPSGGCRGTYRSNGDSSPLQPPHNIRTIFCTKHLDFQQNLLHDCTLHLYVHHLTTFQAFWVRKKPFVTSQLCLKYVAKGGRWGGDATSPKAQYGVILTSHVYKVSLFLGYRRISNTDKAYLIVTKIYAVTFATHKWSISQTAYFRLIYSRLPSHINQYGHISYIAFPT